MSDFTEKLSMIICQCGDSSKDRYEDDRIIIQIGPALAEYHVYVKLDDEFEEVFRQKCYSGVYGFQSYWDNCFHKGSWYKYIRRLHNKALAEKKRTKCKDHRNRNNPCSVEANVIFN